MEEEAPVRVLVTVSDKSAHWEKCWSSSEELLSIAFHEVKTNGLLHTSYKYFPQLRLLAKRKWSTRVFLVFDVANTAYNPEDGHLPGQNNLPVIIVRFGRNIQAYRPNQPTQNQVNNDIRRTHNVNGFGSVPPFIEDNTSGILQYLNPREPQML